MSYQPQPDTGFLFPNKYHKQGDKLPCLKGTCNIAGKEYEVAMWAPKPGKKGYYARFKLTEETTEGNEVETVPETKPEPKRANKAPSRPPARKSASGLFKK